MSNGTPFDAQQASILAGQVFQPRTPISTRELFAGRWNQLQAVADAVGEIGLHVVIYGERGVGKTSLANVIRPVLHVFDRPPSEDAAAPPAETRLVVKINAHQTDGFATVWKRALDEISISEETPVLGFSRRASEKQLVLLREAWSVPDEPGIDDVRRALAGLPDSVFIIDEFDRIQRSAADQFTDLIKALSDFQTPVTMVIVGVADTVEGLIENHESIGRALVQIPMPRMEPKELREILTKAQEKLPILFEPRSIDRIVRMSLGLPHYTHLVGLLAVRRACKRSSSVIQPDDVTDALSDATSQAEQTLISQYAHATRSAHRDALYEEVLLACAVTASANTDALGYFQPSSVVEPLQAVLPEKKRVEIATFNRHLADFCDEKRSAILQRTGQERAYRYRFRNPLLPPYVIIKGIAEKILTVEQLEALTAAQ
ncbi:KAP family P-loop domain protein [Phycisphaerae bacterium RAS1]|nr:KAP family P-loop domain protein [Phycisphaerae bacterium RAS1]